MKKCGNIRRDLSAYIDDELSEARRAEIASHLESCAQCREELVELEKLTAGVAALPRLQPAPRFLKDVRRKIAQGEDPEAPTWWEQVFEPFWLKVPLQIAALVLIVGLVLRGEHPTPTQPQAQNELASNEADNNNNRPEMGAQNEDAKAVAEEARPAAPVVEEAKKEPPRAPALQKDEQESAPVAARDVATASSGPQSTVNKSTASQENSAGGGRQQAASPQRLATTSSGGSSYQSPMGTAMALGSIRNYEPVQSKPREQVTVQSGNFDGVRNRAQQLATRCNGKVFLAPQSTTGTGQVLFVEVPREYAAAFKVELAKTSAAASAPGSTAKDLDTTNFTGAAQDGGMGAILTGGAATNSVIVGAASSTTVDQVAPRPTVILEIHVVEPTN